MARSIPMLICGLSALFYMRRFFTVLPLTEMMKIPWDRSSQLPGILWRYSMKYLFSTERLSGYVWLEVIENVFNQRERSFPWWRAWEKLLKLIMQKLALYKNYDFPKRSIKRILLPLLFLLIIIGGYFVIKGVLSTRNSSFENISTINSLMEEENYEGALEFIGSLNRSLTKDTVISLLNDQCEYGAL